MKENPPVFPPPLPQHPFVKVPIFPIDPFENPSMSDCLESLERIRCVMAFVLSHSPSEKDLDSAENVYSKDVTTGRSFLISSLHESLTYIGELMMNLNDKERENIEKQLREIEPIAAGIYGYKKEECTE